MRKASYLTARLYLEGQEVGEVAVRGWEGAWGFGEFSPGAGFQPFEPMYARWSQLMHQDDGRPRLSRNASQELRRLEGELAGIEARLFFPNEQRCQTVVTVNIDGALIEWKERWSDGSPCPVIPMVRMSPVPQQRSNP